MSSNSSTAPPPRPAPAPPPRALSPLSPAPSRPSDSSPPPAPSRSQGAQSSTPTKPHSPLEQPSSARSPTAPAHRGGTTLLEIVFAAAGAAALLVILIAACVCCSRKTAPRRRKRPYNPMHYYADSSSSVSKATGNSSTSYPTGPQPQWQSDTSAAATLSAFSPPRGGWHAPPPPDMTSGPRAAPPPHEAVGLGKGAFSYEELAAATGNFSAANLLGQGGFGYVHRGVLPGGAVVAVKRLKADNGQGEREFQAEVDIISRVHHRHLVSLVGHCVAGARRVLVYQFVPNKTLEFHLHGKGQPVMEWSTRLRVALGSAKGLAYLHEDCHPRIIHRDIKSANILLDNNFEAKVTDFGLAKLTSDDSTHMSTRVMGTFGYLAPEYASSGKLTDKSDVFSYGVVLLELLTGRRPIDDADAGAGTARPLFLDDGLVDWARPALARRAGRRRLRRRRGPKAAGQLRPRGDGAHGRLRRGRRAPLRQEAPQDEPDREGAGGGHLAGGPRRGGAARAEHGVRHAGLGQGQSSWAMHVGHGVDQAGAHGEPGVQRHGHRVRPTLNDRQRRTIRRRVESSEGSAAPVAARVSTKQQQQLSLCELLATPAMLEHSCSARRC